MRHNVAGRLFGRTANQRKALLRGLMAAVVEHERIETTVAKAKETRKLVERLVTLAKRGDVHSKRLALSKLPNRTLIVKLFDEIAPRFSERPGGYLRIVRTRRRVNDRAELAVLEFVDYEEKVMGKKKTKPATKAEKKAKPTPKKTEKSEGEGEEKEEKKTTAKKTTAKKTTAKKATAKKATAKKATAKKATAKKATAKKTTAKKTTAKKTTAKKTTAKKEK